MLGLFGTLNLGTRALQAQQAGVEVAGQNLANVNTAGYARQRVVLQTSGVVPTSFGPQGTGVDAQGIRQLRNALVDGQISREASVGGYWQAQQRSLQSAQSALGQVWDASTGGGLDAAITGLFNAFQGVATDPTSLANRQALVSQAQGLATALNLSARRLDALRVELDDSITREVAGANTLASEIAALNEQISRAEFPGGGPANDLRDLRQAKLEALAQLVDFETGTSAQGELTLSIGEVTLVSGGTVGETLEAQDAGDGTWRVRATSGTPLALTGGSIQGTMDARDGALRDLRAGLDALAATLVSEVNTLHRSGFSLTGSTGADFFTGTDAASLGVNTALRDDPSLIQAAGLPAAGGDNTVALALARLADLPHAGLGNQPFGSAYGTLVARLGHGLATANAQLAGHEAVKSLLSNQREAVSGVSLDEEMADLVRYQKAYQASARLVSVVDEMLETVLALGR